MKKFNDTVIIVLTIASTIVGYLTWGLMALIVLLKPAGGVFQHSL